MDFRFIGVRCAHRGNFHGAVGENFKVLLRGLQHLKIDESVVDLGSRRSSPSCFIKQGESVGFCWAFFRDVMVKEDATTTDISIKIEWVKIKARVFFQPDAFVVYGFEEGSFPHFSSSG